MNYIMKIKLGSIKVLTLTGLAALLGLLPLQSALAFNLGSAGPGSWALLDIGTGTVTMVTDNIGGGSLVTGNVGIHSSDNLTLGGGSQINGDLFLGNTASTTFGGAPPPGGFVTGTTHTNQDTLLGQARTDALAAAAAATALGGTPTVFSGQTLTAGTYALASLVMSNQTLTLSGAGDFVLNIAGVFTMGGSSLISLTNGATADHVLFNMQGSFSGGLFNADIEGTSIANGIILSPTGDVKVNGGVNPPPRTGLFGEVIAGGNVLIQSSSGIDGVTVPDAGSTLVLMSLGLGFLVSAKRKLLS
jgi:hypothetical protein